MGEGEKIPFKDLPKLFTPEYFQALKFWKNYKKFGLPYSGGWAEQPYTIINLLKDFDEAYDEWQTQQT